jgi:magnesium chelatase subunit D
LSESGGGAAVSLADARLAAACLALQPLELGGIVVRTDRGPVCEAWLQLLRSMLADGAMLRRLPLHIDDERLLGGTDLAGTLAAGRLVHSRGLLAEADGGVLLINVAERLSARLAALLAAALDSRDVLAVGGGAQRLQPARFAIVALDAARGEDERCPAVLSQRLAMHIDLQQVDPGELGASLPDRAQLLEARRQLGQSRREDGVLEGSELEGSELEDTAALRALCTAALACGIESLRAPLLALRVARASAALAGRASIGDTDLQAAARLVLGPRARSVPDSPPADQSQSSGDGAQAPQAPQTPPPADADAPPVEPQAQRTLEEQVLAAAQAAMPAGLLEQLSHGAAGFRRGGDAGRRGAQVLLGRHGRPAGVRAGRPRAGARLNIVATLRSAAPWQRLRHAQARAAAPRVLVRTQDFRVTWLRQRSQTVTVFVLDASGSSAMHRLAELKGAVELLLAECYVRRDQVAVVAFRGRDAQLVLPPTRSLVRAKRSLALLPGGGATPLAAGLALAHVLSEQLRRRCLAPALVLLTDGQANIALDGASGRQRAQDDAVLAARRLGAAGFKSLLIDTAPRPQPLARALAGAMQARYLPLPYADARALLGAVQSAG